MKTTKFLSACLLLLPFMSCTQVSDTKDKAVENKVDKLLSKMTLEEKIGQMNQISSFGNIEEMSVLIKKGEIGSILNEIGSGPCQCFAARGGGRIPAWEFRC